jgi:hypothetical protein
LLKLGADVNAKVRNQSLLYWIVDTITRLEKNPLADIERLGEFRKIACLLKEAEAPIPSRESVTQPVVTVQQVTNSLKRLNFFTPEVMPPLNAGIQNVPKNFL